MGFRVMTSKQEALLEKLQALAWPDVDLHCALIRAYGEAKCVPTVRQIVATILRMRWEEAQKKAKQ